MKILRFLLLALALISAALAAFIFARLSLAGAIPVWLLERFPSLSLYESWLPQDLLTLALAATLVACLSFGLAAPAWEGVGQRRVRASVGAAPMGAVAFALLLGLGVVLAIMLAIWTALGLPAGWLQSGLWLGGLVLLLGLALVLQRERPFHIWGDDTGYPEQGWPLLIPILLLAACLYLWQGAWLPATIPSATISTGLQAQAQGDMLRSGLLANGSAGLPWLATLASALALALARNPFSGLLWAGSATALALVAATWLLGCELLRRAPSPIGGPDGTDDGRRPALLGALATAILMPMLHLARLPDFLLPVLWGVLGLWALLRALRTGSFPTLATAGLLSGLALLMGPSGLVLAGVGGAAWLGMALTRGRFLQVHAGGVGWRGFWLWLVALAVAAAPRFCIGGCAATSAGAQWFAALGGFGPGLPHTLAAMGISLTQALAAPTLGLFTPLLGALFLLALGGLLFHVDQPIGWILLGWLGLGVIAAAPFAQQGVPLGALALLVPVCGLALAFALDRTQTALVRSLGGWARTATTLLAVGILLLAALDNLRDYPERMGLQPNLATAAARVVAELAPDAAPLALVVDGANVDWDTPALRFAGGISDAQRLPALRAADPTAWPVTLPAGAHLLLPPNPSRETLLLAQQRYPGGTLRVVRDVYGNAALYVYTLAGGTND